MILGDLVDAGLADIRTGPFGTQLRASDYVADGRPVLNVRNVGFGEVRAEKLEFVDEATAHRLSGHILQEGDIVFGRKGAVERHAFIAGRFVGALQGSDCIRLRILDRSAVRPAFVSFALRTQEHREWMQNFCSHGATMASLNQEILRQIQLPSLELPEQDGIIRILSAIDELIEDNRRRIEVLEQIAQAIYREWFVHFRYPGHEAATFVDSALGSIPRGWEAIPLRELVSTQYGYTESASVTPIGPHYLRGMDINKTSYVDWSTVPYCPIDERDRVRFLVTPGDVFVIRMADPGKVGICESAVDAVFASYLVRLRPIDDRISSYLLFYTLRDEAYQSWVTGASTGSTRKSVSAQVMTEPLIVLPSRDLVSMFEKTVRPIRSLLTGFVQGNASLAALRDLLLPRLVTGQIDVSHLDLDALKSAVA